MKPENPYLEIAKKVVDEYCFESKSLHHDKTGVPLLTELIAAAMLEVRNKERERIIQLMKDIVDEKIDLAPLGIKKGYGYPKDCEYECSYIFEMAIRASLQPEGKKG